MSVQYDSKGKYYTQIIQKIPVSAMIQTLHQQIHGMIHVRDEDRLLDSLNRNEDFLAVTDAEVFDTQGNLVYTSKFIAVQRNAIVWILPDTEISQSST